MHHIITPTEYQELIKRKSVAQMTEKCAPKPSQMTFSIIMGYSAALRVLTTSLTGKVSVLLN